MHMTRSRILGLDRTSVMAKHMLERVSRYWHHRAMHQDVAPSLPWWRSQLFGYPVGFLLVIITMLASLVVRIPHFVWTPFCLISVIVGFVWGVGPALVTIALGFLALNF